MSTRKSARTAHAVTRSRIFQGHVRRARNMVRRAGQIAVLGLLALCLAACAGSIIPHNDPATPDTQSGGWISVVHVNVDGKTVPCVTWKKGYAGGISCDFARSK